LEEQNKEREEEKKRKQREQEEAEAKENEAMEALVDEYEDEQSNKATQSKKQSEPTVNRFPRPNVPREIFDDVDQ